jgi:hypothetical protein
MLMSFFAFAFAKYHAIPANPRMIIITLLLVLGVNFTITTIFSFVPIYSTVM